MLTIAYSRLLTAKMKVLTPVGETRQHYPGLRSFIPSLAFLPSLFTASISSAGDSEALHSPGGTQNHLILLLPQG